MATFAAAMADDGYAIVGVDNLPGSVPLETTGLPERVCLVFGSEGPGLTDELVAVCERLVAISQYGSTRSLNAGAAAAIAMYHWACNGHRGVFLCHLFGLVDRRLNIKDANETSSCRPTGDHTARCAIEDRRMGVAAGTGRTPPRPRARARPSQ